MENKISFYNNLLNFNLKQTMNTASDLLYNMQSLKQLQCSINSIQAIKDKEQMQVNMAALTLLRVLVLDESETGIILFRNLIRRFYPLNDERIIKYEKLKTTKLENAQVSVFKITNECVLKRKGTDFMLNGYRCVEDSFILDYFENDSVCDFHNCPDITNGLVSTSSYRDAIMKNEFTQWDWELVKEIHKGWKQFGKGRSITCLLYNRGFLAQLGMDNIDNVFDKLQEITGEPLSKESMNDIRQNYELWKFELNSYLPLSNEFIIQHQDDLDWIVLQRNPRIQWNLELINLFLMKMKNTVSESEWDKVFQGSRAMYAAIENLLNDEVLSDIEKLYDI